MYLIHFAVSLLSELNISWAWLTNAPMPQPLSVFDCVVKAKFVIGEQGWCSKESTRLPPMSSKFDSSAVLFGSLPFTKTNISKFQFNADRGPA